MLKQNTTINCQYPLRFVAGPTLSGERSCWGRSERRNVFLSEAGWAKTAGIPLGNLAPGVLTLPQTGGGLSARTTSTGGISNALGVLGLNAIAALTGSGGISSAFGGLIVNLVANINGTGGITNAELKAFLNAVANLMGSGGMSSADLNALGDLLAGLTGQGAVTATASGVGALAAAITSYGSLTPEGLRDAVWSAVATSYNAPGTMGQKLNNAASGGVDYGALADAVWSNTSAVTLTDRMSVAHAILKNKTVTDPITGVMTVYADDGVTPMFTAQMYEGTGTGQTYRGQGAERREKLE